MADYGIEILTSTGRQTSAALETFGLFKTITCTTQEGTAYVPEFDSTAGFFFPIILDSYYMQVFSFNNTTKVFTWAKASGYPITHSSNFEVHFFRGAV